MCICRGSSRGSESSAGATGDEEQHKTGQREGRRRWRDNGRWKKTDLAKEKFDLKKKEIIEMERAE